MKELLKKLFIFSHLISTVHIKHYVCTVLRLICSKSEAEMHKLHHFGQSAVTRAKFATNKRFPMRLGKISGDLQQHETAISIANCAIHYPFCKKAKKKYPKPKGSEYWSTRRDSNPKQRRRRA